MLKIAGLKSRYCDGVSRRTWMQIGSLGLGGMALPQMLQAESENAEAVEPRASSWCCCREDRRIWTCTI